MEYLEEQSPGAVCDDCISKALRIFPRQQVNQICRRLLADGFVVRQRGPCTICGATKLANALATLQASAELATVRETLTAYFTPQPQRTGTFNIIEEMRSHIIRFCRQLWNRDQKDISHSGSAVIGALRDKGLVPSHQANMMLTLCSLRNCYTYEQLDFGAHEIAVAENAWAIIDSWASKKHRELWHLTSRSG